MVVFALTGGIASGKSTVSDLFQSFNITVIDADIAARKVVEPGSPALAAMVEHFGQEILETDSNPAQLDRKKLRDIIFNDPDERQWVEACLHPQIRQWMYQQTELADSTYVIHAIPLLVETGLYQQYNEVIVIDVPEATQIERLIQRDNCSEEVARKILKSQASRGKRKRHATYVINNNNSLEELENSVKSLHNQLLQRALKTKH